MCAQCQKPKKAMSLFLLPVVLTALVFPQMQCSDKEPPPRPTITGYVSDAADSTVIAQANVILFDANTNAPVARSFTDANGLYIIQADGGTYYLKITAQGYASSPPPAGGVQPFDVAWGQIVDRNVYLDSDPQASTAGSIWGYVKFGDGTGAVGMLVVAADAANTSGISTASGPDGYYVLHNAQPGTYTVTCYYQGYQQQGNSVSVTVAADSAYGPIDLTIAASNGSTLSGKITYLAAPNAYVDITLINPATLEAVPGLFTFDNPQEHTYSLSGIPVGSYIAWATYRNDGYVMDPDWIRKNGLPTVSFAAAGESKTVDFSVTDAIPIVSPTNPADTITPRIIQTTTPTFKWESYSGRQEYIIEVYDAQGNVIWGGFGDDGLPAHAFISPQLNQIAFNFDNSATEPLRQGDIFRWKIYADGDPKDTVLELISASEDLLGLFMVDTSAAP